MSASRAAPPEPAAWLSWAALLAAVVLGQAAHGFQPGASVDFYQFWAVSAARAEQPGLPTPWTAPDAYRAVLERRFADEARPELQRLHRFRMSHFEPFGSPLLYLAFAPFPNEYPRALGVLRGLQLLAFAAGVLVLGRLAGLPPRVTLLLPGVLAVAYRPFGDDLLTGNLNAFQLGALAGLIHWSVRGLRAAAAPARARDAGVLLCALAGLALVKPNLAPAALGLALAVGLRLGAGGFARAGLWATPGAAALLLAPCLYFHSPRVWLDWVGRVFAAEPARLAEYAVAAGNTSTPRLLEEWLGVPPLLSAAALALLLLASLAAVPRRSWRDPGLAAGFGVVLVLGAAPLVWFHYFVLALLPGLWLIGPGRGGPLPRVLAGLALGIYAGFYLPAVPRALLPGLHALWSLGWVLLWLALLLRGRASLPARATVLSG